MRRSLGVCALLLCAATAPVGAQDYATDLMTGYAVGGHDPVAFFIDKKPRNGDAEHELRWGGTIWVFVNEGNRAAFVADPDIYAPGFAGCDPYSLSAGFATAGKPSLFALQGGRLLLFHSEINRFLFLADPKTYLANAEENAERLGCRSP